MTLNAESALQRFSLVKFAHRRVKARKTEIKTTDTVLYAVGRKDQNMKAAKDTKGQMDGWRSSKHFIVYSLWTVKTIEAHDD